MTDTPDFTVILATYNRGRFIAPTIRSALYQTHTSFELLVIGDGCTDDTGAIVRAMGDPRVRWQNIPHGGSQTYPNNAGIAQARGRFIAYLGHDDIWAPEHLSRLYSCFLANDNVSFVVSGCLHHGPPDSGVHEVTGLVPENGEERRYFFPPTSFAHRRQVTEIVGPWRDPREIRAPVDRDLLVRAVEAGLVFAYTDTITAHKFTATWHYLSSLTPRARNQQDLLALLSGGKAGPFVESALKVAHARGTFNRISSEYYEKRPLGGIYDDALAVRGLAPPPLQALSAPTKIVQTDEQRGYDWFEYSSKPVPRRWSGENPRPRLLVPYTSRSPVGLAVEIVRVSDPGIVPAIKLSMNGQTQLYKRVNGPRKSFVLASRTQLKPDDYSILQFDLLDAQSSIDPRFPHGRIAVGHILLAPLTPPSTSLSK